MKTSLRFFLCLLTIGLVVGCGEESKNGGTAPSVQTQKVPLAQRIVEYSAWDRKRYASSSASDPDAISLNVQLKLKNEIAGVDSPRQLDFNIDLDITNGEGSLSQETDGTLADVRVKCGHEGTFDIRHWNPCREHVVNLTLTKGSEVEALTLHRRSTDVEVSEIVTESSVGFPETSTALAGEHAQGSLEILQVEGGPTHFSLGQTFFLPADSSGRRLSADLFLEGKLGQGYLELGRSARAPGTRYKEEQAFRVANVTLDSGAGILTIEIPSPQNHPLKKLVVQELSRTMLMAPSSSPVRSAPAPFPTPALAPMR